MVGSSSGAFIAAFAACGVPPRAALHLAHSLLLEHRILTRPTGLLGVWGGLVREWLQRLLPEDAAVRCNAARVRVVVTEWPGLAVRSVGAFTSKEDLIEVLCASSHIPWFMDLRFSAPCRGMRVLDGSTRYLLHDWPAALVPSAPLDYSGARSRAGPAAAAAQGSGAGGGAAAAERVESAGTAAGDGGQAVEAGAGSSRVKGPGAVHTGRCGGGLPYSASMPLVRAEALGGAEARMGRGAAKGHRLSSPGAAAAAASESPFQPSSLSSPVGAGASPTAGFTLSPLEDGGRAQGAEAGILEVAAVAAAAASAVTSPSGPAPSPRPAYAWDRLAPLKAPRRASSTSFPSTPSSPGTPSPRAAASSPTAPSAPTATSAPSAPSPTKPSACAWDRPVLMLDPRADAALRARWGLASCLQALSLGGALAMMDVGAAFAEALHGSGALQGL
ncbi:hypothetical protein HYH03_018244 [Edaphochlamys debaryana]|uniref:Patatin n=1 Tax=Edaphochlamys debaryana TaxID=47281 RepID=A0A835XEZ8_9CHLO|nr:hypothetical protein HYH03_018244 [Edaphochlamys debaryana]|eukprot:KAG2482853.1 hypothetical protein HYH03_018244 [Edaphochlamys debaryana]